MCWSNSLPSPCTTIPGASAAAEGWTSSRPLALTAQATEKPAAPLDTLHPEIWFKAQLFPYMTQGNGGLSAEQNPHKRNPSVHNQTFVRKCHTPIWSQKRSPPLTREQAQPTLLSHSEWELYDNFEWQLSLVLITSFFLFQEIPAMLPDPGVLKIDTFKWMWNLLIFSRC